MGPTVLFPKSTVLRQISNDAKTANNAMFTATTQPNRNARHGHRDSNDGNEEATIVTFHGVWRVRNSGEYPICTGVIARARRVSTT